jgi:hypothetical protein
METREDGRRGGTCHNTGDYELADILSGQNKKTSRMRDATAVVAAWEAEGCSVVWVATSDASGLCLCLCLCLCVGGNVRR